MHLLKTATYLCVIGVLITCVWPFGSVMSIYRNSVFVVKGLREFCKSGYEYAAKSFDKTALDVDISNQAYLITGANSGIGKSAALAVAQRGGTVHMICRNQTRGEEAKQEIETTTGNQKVFLHVVDMSDSQKVSDFAREFAESGKELHVLVNNAGCMVNTREMTSAGYEMNFATNALGTYILTSLLIPVLQKAENSRVITVSSGGMYTQKLDLNNLQSEKSFDGTMSYAHQKRQQVIMTEQWAKRYPEIKFFTMHPGWADTPAVRNSMPDFYARFKNKLRTPEQGADTVLWLCLAKAPLDAESGGFYLDRKPQSKHLTFAWTRSSAGDEEKLMTVLEDMAAKFRTK
ncbi:dehydrogenase/reductase SDR family member 12-like [Lytechinus pictus]|uniref:dehydrogenase/reductase SDR family member 12-like n=1 Tax=Lytechinus pictus TaxID=7653 RepID=UPI0030B9DE0F